MSINWNRAVLIALACSKLASGQTFDHSANGTLQGAYLLKELALSEFSGDGNFSQARSLSGAITFDGNGNYSFSGQLNDSTAGSGPQSYSVTGQYSVASNGLAQVQPLLDQSVSTEDRTIYGAVTQSIFVGSSTEGSLNDLVIAIPAGSATSDSSVQGEYQAGTLGFLQGTASMVFDAYFTLTADGNGNFSAVTVNGSSPIVGTNQSQTISGATYSLAGNGTGTAMFPTAGGGASTRLFSGSKLLYVSSDGNFILGGDPAGFDIFVGIRPTSGSATNGTYQGTYFLAGLEDSAVNLSAGISDIASFYGSTLAFGNGHAVNHQRLNSVLYNIYDYTFDSSYSMSADGTVTQNFAFLELGPNGQALIDVGRGNNYQLAIGLHAPAYSGGGVYLNPIGIVNSASLAPITNSVAPGELVTMFGTGMASSTATAQRAGFPTSLDDVQVMVNHRLAPVYYVSPTQINAIVPAATTENYATFQVVSNGAVSNPVTVYTSATAPGVFTVNGSGYGAGAILHADYSLVSAQSPAQVGEIVLVFLTGLGATDPPTADGAPGPTNPLSQMVSYLQVLVDGQVAPVNFAGLAPGLAGLYQINIQIPAGVRSGDDYLDISTPSAYHSQATIAIQ
jgi:uncharacterized protein (TIGR03437 family)